MRSRRLRTSDGVVVGRTKILRQTPCGKQGYTSRKLALHAAAIARNETGEPIHAYRCSVGCHCWHLGHPPGWRQEQARLAAESEAS